jgi:hypothetical protein
MASNCSWDVTHMNVMTAFLNLKIDCDNIDMSLPEGIEQLKANNYPDSHIVRLHKALYRLKQAPQLWYQDINEFLTSIGFTKVRVEPNLYLV